MSHNLCLIEIERAFTTAEKFYGRVFPRVPITFSNRMTHSAGRAFYSWNALGVHKGKEIRLSNKLLVSEGAAFIERTPGHEAAHIIAVLVYGKEGRGHGVRWQEVMAVLGLESKRCHNFTVPKAKTFKYVSNGITKELKVIRHNKLQRGKVPAYMWKGGVTMKKENWVPE